MTIGDCCRHPLRSKGGHTRRCQEDINLGDRTFNDTLAIYAARSALTLDPPYQRWPSIDLKRHQAADLVDDQREA
jgi:hypothetical protein